MCFSPLGRKKLLRESLKKCGLFFETGFRRSILSRSGNDDLLVSISPVDELLMIKRHAYSLLMLQARFPILLHRTKRRRQEAQRKRSKTTLTKGESLEIWHVYFACAFAVFLFLNELLLFVKWRRIVHNSYLNMTRPTTYAVLILFSLLPYSEISDLSWLDSTWLDYQF
jgi:hypothetical protein